MTNRRPMTAIETARYNLRRALDFERRRLTEAEWREMCAWVRSQVTDTNCGRCKASIPVGEEEFCWYCHHALCHECWDGYGHCGHARADEINAEGMARAERAEQRRGGGEGIG